MSEVYKFCDKGQVLNDYKGDEDILAELIRDFVDDYPNLLDEISTSLKEINYEDLERSAHTLKGMICYFHSPELENLAYSIENSGNSKTTDGCEDNLVELKEKLEFLKGELSNLLIELES